MYKLTKPYGYSSITLISPKQATMMLGAPTNEIMEIIKHDYSSTIQEVEEWEFEVNDITAKKLIRSAYKLNSKPTKAKTAKEINKSIDMFDVLMGKAHYVKD